MNSMEHTCSPKLTPGSKLVRNLLLKRELLKRNDPRHKEIKTALIIDRGTTRGAYGGGVAVGLEKLGMTEVFDFATGVSAGVPDCAYFLAGQSVLGTHVYWENIATHNFFNPLRFWKLVDFDYFERVLREIKPLDIEAIRSSRTELLMPTTDVYTGKGIIFSSRNRDVDLITAIKASVSLPIIYNKPVKIKNSFYLDGAISFPLLTDWVIKELGCTDILVVINYPHGFTGSAVLPLGERVAAKVFLRRFSEEYQKAYSKKGKILNESMMKLWNNEFPSSVNVGVLCPGDQKISPYERNKDKIKSFASGATEQTLKIFNDY